MGVCDSYYYRCSHARRHGTDEYNSEGSAFYPLFLGGLSDDLSLRRRGHASLAPLQKQSAILFRHEPV